MRTKPCPFCGNEPCPNDAMRMHAGQVWYLACCMVQTEDFASYEAAVEAWNRRPQWVVSLRFHTDEPLLEGNGWYVHSPGPNRPNKSPLFAYREQAERVAEWLNNLGGEFIGD